MMDDHELFAAIEAMLFVSGEPIMIPDMARALEIAPFQLEEALDRMAGVMTAQKRGLKLNRFGEHIQLTTAAEMKPYIEKLLQPVQKQSLSQSALETLAIIAYRQPVTKLEMEQIRGVKCDYSVQSLIAKGLITEVGRRDAVGRPILYGTTDTFLSHFGLRTLEELPAPPDQPPGRPSTGQSMTAEKGDE